MAASLRHWVIIPAAGTSQRMGGKVPKQYFTIEDATVIEHSIGCFLRHPEISGVIVALHAKDQYWHELDVSKHEKIHTVIGGNTRAESVNNALLHLEKKSVQKDDFVLVHDAARPCLRYSDLELLMNQLKDDEVGGILAAPVSDTLKLSNAKGFVKETLEREKIWRAFTPQMFRLKYLSNAMQHCIENKIAVTDEASAIEAQNLPVKLVRGQSDNIKITQSEDLALATAVLKKMNQ